MLSKLPAEQGVIRAGAVKVCSIEHADSTLEYVEFANL